jgi:N utilization substance protein B
MSPDKRNQAILRRRARVTALEALYEHDVSGHDALAALRRRLEGVASDRTEPTPLDEAYAVALVEGVEQHLPAIDSALAEAAAAWPLDQMAKVDKAILRLAIYELVFDNGVPVKAVINEAVELAKLYGGESSPRFVNGVLGTISQQAARS